ncbi:hypothetical protein [Novosphingobium jiangmenense]|uniref:Uncharacterized protein n=1 Tax=Novosphingobium jiangmenense TaxID=2791981 RepID=A0ABS0HB81_9SPHN|nr:hypothetical protein [Novosphingobium jiangmenense]MBF9149411.1 hypothetical protein [Novosphingobium jiangmenense]
MERSERFQLFLDELMSATAVASIEEAKLLLEQTLVRIENEHSGVPDNPDGWQNDGRMYPPKEDRRRSISNEVVAVYDSRGHRISFGHNGSIRIEIRRGLGKGTIVLDKPGQDGKTLP